MHKDLYVRDDIVKFYILRKERKREFSSIEDCMDTIQGLEEFTKKSKERLITVASYSNINRNNLGANRKTKIRRKATVWILQMTN